MWWCEVEILHGPRLGQTLSDSSSKTGASHTRHVDSCPMALALVGFPRPTPDSLTRLSHTVCMWLHEGRYEDLQ